MNWDDQAACRTNTGIPRYLLRRHEQTFPCRQRIGRASSGNERAEGE
jgi:hypothetical protein